MTKTPPTALEKAMRLLAARPLSELELLTRLRRAGFSDFEADNAIEECKKHHYIDDEMLTVDCVSALRQRNLGSRQIKYRLLKRGLDADNISALLAEEPQEETEAALRAMESKSRMLRNEPDPRKKREKLFRFLAGRGFSPEIIFQVLEKSSQSDYS